MPEPVVAVMPFSSDTGRGWELNFWEYYYYVIIIDGDYMNHVIRQNEMCIMWLNGNLLPLKCCSDVQDVD